MYCTNQDPVDVVISRIQTDLMDAGAPRPEDVVEWAAEWAKHRGDLSAADIGIWFTRCYLPVAIASSSPSSNSATNKGIDLV